jgi:tRNA dimethylallyltransferase
MQNFKGKPLIAVVGPTGTGKSSLAVRLALGFNGEIINADSRQVYRGMDIGTAKPSREDMQTVPHHLYDIADPGEDFSVAVYKQKAYETIDDIYSRHKLPLLVGGSGQYVWSVLEGWEIPRVVPDQELRKRLERRAEELGPDSLYNELLKVDPVSAEKIDPRNVRRVIRALEVFYQSNKPMSELKTKNPPGFDSLIIGLTAERKSLYQRTDERVDIMLLHGLVEEVGRLKLKGYGRQHPAMNTIGYSHILDYLDGMLTLEEAVEKIKHDTHRFIRHQYAWFRLKDERICWFDIDQMTFEDMSGIASEHLRQG